MDEAPTIDMSKFAVPVPGKARIIDFACTFVGAALALAALFTGPAALLLMIPALGLLGTGIFLFTRTRRMADPDSVAARLQQVLEEAYGSQANTPDGRAQTLWTFLRVAEELAKYASGVPTFGIFGGGKGFDTGLVFVVAEDRASGKCVHVRVPEPPARLVLYLVDLSQDEWARAQTALPARPAETSGVLKVVCADRAESVAAVEQTFRDVFAAAEAHDVEYRLTCAQPVWVLGGAG